MLKIDGSEGEGGGQILRTSLALSMVTGTPVRIDNIRAGRAKPGLMRQHLTAVLAAAEVSQGRVEGAEVGSTSLGLHPRDDPPGEHRFAIGTAGSVTLVLQTVLPALLTASGPSTPDARRGDPQSHGPALRVPGPGVPAAGQPDGSTSRGEPGTAGVLPGRWGPFYRDRRARPGARRIRAAGAGRDPWAPRAGDPRPSPPGNRRA